MRTRRKLRAAGLQDNPLLNLPNVICTPHVAGLSETVVRNIATQVAEEILRMLRGEKPRVLGNPALWPRLTYLK